MISFEQKLNQHGYSKFLASEVKTLQLNVGKKCNQACKHCHVDAGPNRTEEMTRETADKVLLALQLSKIKTVDITGGAPELNPSFEYVVTAAKKLGCHIIVRCNLTVLLVDGKEHLPEFFRDNEIEVISSLPYFLADRTDSQRGEGVFEASLKALWKLNQLGYGQEGTNLLLNLVYNPVGAYLPPDQASVERDFKKELFERYRIVFNRLYTITNMPINRYLNYLHKSGNYEKYMQRLIESFNPGTIDGLMCRHLVSVSWDGNLYDCDFNQMLNLPIKTIESRTIDTFNSNLLSGREIETGLHCFGCTAGTGSSCGGTIT
ncbi:MAG: arsenosugar biosynthesis radical SAM protein ArsS [Blastocatellia bacterium]|nr:arsenosugar biosynthesis radical SAM protein ArsS [Blastocatellia bacterium]